MRLFSNEYFTRNTIPRNKTNPPIHAKSLIPRNASQSIATRGASGADVFTGGASEVGFLGNAGSGIVDCRGSGGGTVAGAGDGVAAGIPEAGLTSFRPPSTSNLATRWL